MPIALHNDQTILQKRSKALSLSTFYPTFSFTHWLLCGKDNIGTRRLDVLTEGDIMRLNKYLKARRLLTKGE